MTEVIDACEHLLASRRFEELTMEDIAQTARIQVGAKLRQLMPQLSRRRALEQGRMVSMVMGVLIDNLVYLPAAAQKTLRRETYDMLSRYVGLAR